MSAQQSDAVHHCFVMVLLLLCKFAIVVVACRASRDMVLVHSQLTAVDGRRAFVVLPNDPELVDILAKNGVDISVSEGDQQGNYVSLLGNLLFPLIAFGGLFFLFRCALQCHHLKIWMSMLYVLEMRQL